MSRATAELMVSVMFALPFTLFLAALSFGAFKLGIPAPLTSIVLIGIAIGGAKLSVPHIRKIAERYTK
ncbi:MAG: hypothetical protein ABWX90_00895 [Candidatus Saccharimonadales bacterium]